MSIIDDNQREIVRLGTVHSTVFKASLYIMPCVLAYFVSMVLRHDTELAVIKDRMAIHAAVRESAPKVAAKSADSEDENKP